MAVFPPIIDTYMPIQVIANEPIENVTEGPVFKVQFTLSPYNGLTDIKQYACVSINNQNTNESMLSGDYKSLGMKLFAVNWDINGVGTIEVTKNDLAQGIQTQQYYKIQIRFIDSNAENPSSYDVSILSQWLKARQDLGQLSEWSSVCLVRCMKVPKISWILPDPFQSPIVTLLGNIYFEDGESETLDKYQFLIYKKDAENNLTLVDKSDWIQANQYDNSNSIYYKNKKILIDVDEFQSMSPDKIFNFVFDFNYITRNNFQGSVKNVEFNIKIDDNAVRATGYVIPDEYNARVGIILFSDLGDDEESADIAVLRTTARSGFKEYEEIKIVHLTKENTKKEKEHDDHEPIQNPVVVYDYSIESMAPYKYFIQNAKANGIRGALIPLAYYPNIATTHSSVMSSQTNSSLSMTNNAPIVCNFEYSYLNGDNKQLKISLSDQINGIRYNISESRTDTIGSVYPYIQRNANMKYRSFDISGIISILSDIQEESDYFQGENTNKAYWSNIGLFTDRRTLLTERDYDFFKEYNYACGITDFNDIYLERLYREKVMEFLYNSKPKMFRSATEGNIIVKLMDVSFSPNAQLGRLTYNFSCQAIEVAPCTIENLDKYDIQTIGNIYKEELPETKYQTTQAEGVVTFETVG